MLRPLVVVAMFVAGLEASAAELLRAEVTYVTGSTIYVNAGRDEGVALGARLELMRGETIVAIVEVRDVSTHRAACRIAERFADPEIGDLLRFPAQVSSGPEGAPLDAEPAEKARDRPGRRSLRAAGIRGRIGVRYLWIKDRGAGAADLSQPAIDLRIDGAGIGGSPWGLAVDVRARQTYRDLSDGTRDDDSRTRVYRLAVSRTDASDPWSLTLGRQYSPALAAVSIFDGVSADYRRKRLNLGLFSGSQPEVSDYGYSTEVREHGVYLQFHGRPSIGRRWSLTTGLIGSYQDSEVNREFLYLQARYSGRRLAAYVMQEVDYNRDWKADAGESSLSSTSSFVSLRYRVNEAVGIHGGFDNRRNVRLYRDRVTPVTEFDDRFRRGYWAGTSIGFLRHFRVGLDARRSDGAARGAADSYTVSLGARRLASGHVDITTRSTRYTNDLVEGWLHALDVGTSVGRKAYVRLSGGVRAEDTLITIPPENDVSWYGLDFDVGLGRRWFLAVSLERSEGDLESVDQLYSTLSYRF